MSITSQITGFPVFGSNPSGFVPLIPNNNGGNAFILTNRVDITIDYSALTFVLNDIPATKDNFLSAVKDVLDTDYMPTVFTDATKNYDAEYVVNSVRLDFEAVTGTTTNDRSIWTQRVYKYFINVTIKVNVN